MVATAIASKKESRTNTLGKLFFDLYTATQISLSLDPSSFLMISVESNFVIVSGAAGQIAVNRSAPMKLLLEGDDDDDLPKPFPEENACASSRQSNSSKIVERRVISTIFDLLDLRNMKVTPLLLLHYYFFMLS